MMIPKILKKKIGAENETTRKRVKVGEVEKLIRGAAKENPGNPIEADDRNYLCVCCN